MLYIGQQGARHTVVNSARYTGDNSALHTAQEITVRCTMDNSVPCCVKQWITVHCTGDNCTLYNCTVQGITVRAVQGMTVRLCVCTTILIRCPCAIDALAWWCNMWKEVFSTLIQQSSLKPNKLLKLK